MAEHSVRARKLKPYREAAKAERRLEKANVNALYQKHIQEKPQLASTPLFRWWQKRAIQKQYAASVRSGQSAAATVENTAKAAKKAAEKSKDGANFLWRHKKGVGIIIDLVRGMGLTPDQQDRLSRRGGKGGTLSCGGLNFISSPFF